MDHVEVVRDVCNKPSRVPTEPKLNIVMDVFASVNHQTQ